MITYFVILMLFMVLGFVLTCVILIFRTASKATAPIGKCRKCHYDLTMVSGSHCPECGHPYFINDRGERISHN